jgi:membrane protein YqaA with SNARE-associated domain
VLKGGPPEPSSGVAAEAMLRRLYDWVLDLSGRKSAPYALGVVSFTESSFFPVPPDVMLVPMSLARPDRAWFYAGICTVTSVLGGLLGYAIGALLFDSVGTWLFRLYGLEGKAAEFRESYAQWGAWIILLKGLTPIPYKLVTITSGFAGYDLLWFTILSLITRGARFGLIAAMIGRYGSQIREIMDKHLTLIVVVLVLIVVAGFASLKLIG